jgi:serine/threonine protein phosphatase PrpC
MCYFDPKTCFLYTATLGDAEANIYRKIKRSVKSLPLSPVRNWKTDEKRLPPNSIQKNFCENPKYWRVQGINVSRALGDKNISLVSQKPKVTKTLFLPEDTLVLCCDGLKDFLLEKEIVKIVSDNQTKSPQELAKALTTASVWKQTGSGDNVTVIVVRASAKEPDQERN